MICPFCLHHKTEVYNTRSTQKGAELWRRRRCLNCRSVFTTNESTDYAKIIDVTQANKKSTEPFIKAKLLLSLARALDHRNDNSAFYLCSRIEQNLVLNNHSPTNRTAKSLTNPIKDSQDHSSTPPKTKISISNDNIIIESLACLKNFDTLAYIKYLAHHSGNLDAKRLKKLYKQ